MMNTTSIKYADREARQYPQLFSNQFIFLYNTFSSEIVYYEGMHNLLEVEYKLVNKNSLIHLVHPDDREEVHGLLNKIHCYWLKNQEHNHQVFNMVFRLKKSNHDFIQVQLQSKIFEVFERGLISYNLITDIQYLYSSNQVVWSLSGNDAWVFERQNINLNKDSDLFTSKELSIIKLLNQGLSNQQIADKLEISIYTLYTHRRNMLKRNKMENIWQLVNLAKKMKLIC
ncbi:MAG: response regulator transcription factor [Cyclobacteriaceae bacterium]